MVLEASISFVQNANFGNQQYNIKLLNRKTKYYSRTFTDDDFKYFHKRTKIAHKAKHLYKKPSSCIFPIPTKSFHYTLFRKFHTIFLRNKYY